ncbi:MAG TPA: MobF family relaxase [Actinospica sp.]|jgi:conjugative relaxase-like TrwC/TraI family protein|nr:MobF family relaxase [Actinospica sp.]
MTIHKLTAGTGYTYLTRQVAGGDVQRERGQSAADYYTAKGNPPGVWAGRGAPLLGLERQQVTEQQMFYLFGLGMHPDAERLADEYVQAHLDSLKPGRDALPLVRRAYASAALGRAFPVYEGLDDFETRVSERLARIAAETGRAVTVAETKKVKAEEAHRQRAAVAGFDVVFAPVKSAAILWALDERAEVRAAVRAAHEAARDAALELLEQHAAFTRTGNKGQAQIETRGLIAAVFDHYDSRAGDPNLHSHVAVSSKVLGVDGKWRALDARGLYRMTVAASEFYNTRFETELAARLGVTFAARPDTVAGREAVREIAGVPVAVIELFSARRSEIEARYEQLVREYRREHGHDPSAGVCHKLARQANLDTREGKKAPRSLQEMRADWTQSAADAYGVDIVTKIMAAVPAQTSIPAPSVVLDPAEIAAQVVANVAEARSTWTVWNLRAEAERLARIEGSFTSGPEHAQFVEQVVERAIGPALCVRVDSVALLNEPARLRRTDGASVFTEHAAARYTSPLILGAEARLVTAATTVASGAPIPAVAANAAIARFESEHGELDPGQRRLAVAFATDRRQLSVGLGPAGSGKTTAMRAFAEICEASGHRVIALGTSAASSAVLGEELGVKAENLHKFLWEHTYGPAADALRSGQLVSAGRARFRIGAGDVILLDEAGMAGTLNLDRLVALAAERGATVRLLGDHRQLGAVESGGALRLLVNEVGATELTNLHRFRQPREAEATLKLRDGDASALEFYQQHNRIIGGSREAMIESAYEGWRADVLAGKTSLMAAATNQDVSALNARARDDRVVAGHVEATGAPLRDGTVAGTGDWIVTRRNDRRLTVCSGRDFVKNGDAWTVTDRREDGSLIVKNQSHGGRAILSADYVRAHVELAYATTAHRAQGSTVDTAHPLITEEMSRENLYVIATRAREYTMLYVATHNVPNLDPDLHLDAVRNDPNAFAAREVLEHVITRESAELSATETIRNAQEHAVNLSVLIPNYQYARQVLVTQSAPAEQISQARVGPELARANLPAWLPPVPAETVLTRDDHAYLTASAELISMRVEALAERAIADRPAWTRKLGNEPEHVEERAAWATRIGTIAAYREQQQIVDNDPHHPAGPHIETNLADYMPYSHAFRAAAELRQAARGRPWSEIDSDVPERPDAQRPDRQRAPRGDTQTQARDRRRESLTPAQRQRIADAAVERRARHAREYEPPIQRQPQPEVLEYRPHLIPPPPQPEHHRGPTIGW